MNEHSTRRPNRPRSRESILLQAPPQLADGPTQPAERDALGTVARPTLADDVTRLLRRRAPPS